MTRAPNMVGGGGGAGGEVIEVAVTALAAGGDGVARDANGRVTFVPRTAPGDRVRVRLGQQTASFARGALVEVIAAGAARVEPPCAAFVAGCGGCQWQHVARDAQLAAKQTLVAQALRKLIADDPERSAPAVAGARGLTVEAIADPCAALGWRRRARFHVAAGRVGLYAENSRDVLPLASCPQLEPALDAALAAVIAASPPDGELALVLGQRGRIVVATAGTAWPGARALIGQAGIVGALVGRDGAHGDVVIELEPGLWGGPWDFAQASAAGNRALIALAHVALGRPDAGARLLELHAGAGNFTRGLVAAGWTVTASDVVAPPRMPAGARFEVGTAAAVLAREDARAAGDRYDAVLLDPPRTGAAEAIAGIVALAPRVVVYVSCDAATLSRDAAKLVAAGYRAERAWPIDLMPQTAHVEIVVRFTRAA